MRRIRRVVACLLVIAMTQSCMAYEPAAQITVKDTSLVALETRSGDRLLDRGVSHGRTPETDREVVRTRDGAIELDGHTVVGRDGHVPGADSLDEMRITTELHVPVCYAARRGGCRRVTIVTPMDNVHVLRGYERPVVVVGIIELAVAASLIFGGVLASTGPGHQTTSGGAILFTSGGVVGLVGLLQTFGGKRNMREIVKE